MVYGTGILSGPGREEDTLLQTVSPGITLQLGPQWTLDYTPSLQFYSNEAYQDNLDHAVTLNGTALWREWGFTFGYGYRSTRPPLLETATQTSLETHSLQLGANRALNQKTSLELGLAQALEFTEAFTDSLSWSTTGWLDHQLNPKLAVAAGISVGYDIVDPGTDMTSQRLLGRIRGQLGHKLTYSINGGAEWRQFLETDAPSKLSPVVDGSVSHQLFETTSLSAFASHQLAASFFTDQFTETTRLGGALRQRFLGELWIDVSGGYSIVKYASAFGPSTAQRRDDTVFFQSGLSVQMLERLNVSVFYRYADNLSDQAGFSFNSNQMGFELSYAW